MIVSIFQILNEKKRCSKTEIGIFIGKLQNNVMIFDWVRREKKIVYFNEICAGLTQQKNVCRCMRTENSTSIEFINVLHHCISHAYIVYHILTNSRNSFHHSKPIELIMAFCFSSLFSFLLFLFIFLLGFFLAVNFLSKWRSTKNLSISIDLNHFTSRSQRNLINSLVFFFSTFVNFVHLLQLIQLEESIHIWYLLESNRNESNCH